MSKFKVEHRYIKPPVKSIINKAEEVIPYGYFCTGDGAKCSNVGGTECPFLQWRKMTPMRLKLHKNDIDIPLGNKLLQYCSYLNDYLEIQDCIKDCGIKNFWPAKDEETDEILYEATSDEIDEDLREKNDELIRKDVEEVIEKIKVKEKYELLTKYAKKN